jgi:hypothetical protein
MLACVPLLAMMHLFFLAGGVGENMNHHKEGRTLLLRLVGGRGEDPPYRTPHPTLPPTITSSAIRAVMNVCQGYRRVFV